MDDRWPFFSVDIELTNECGIACAFCPRKAMSRPRGFMSIEALERIIGKLGWAGSRITFSGMGNPLLHPDWEEAVRIVHRQGLSSGLVLPAAGIDPATIGRLTGSPPSRLEISLPTCDPAAFPRLVPIGDFDTTMGMVRKLTENLRGRIPITFVAVRTGENPGEEIAAREFARSFGVLWRVAACHSRGRNLEAENLVTSASTTGARCGLFSFHSFITWEGNLLACCHDLDGSTVLGNLLRDDVKSLAMVKTGMVDGGMPFPLCSPCDEPGKAFPAASGAFPESGKDASRFLRRLGKTRKRI